MGQHSGRPSTPCTGWRDGMSCVHGVGLHVSCPDCYQLPSKNPAACPRCNFLFELQRLRLPVPEAAQQDEEFGDPWAGSETVPALKADTAVDFETWYTSTSAMQKCPCSTTHCMKEAYWLAWNAALLNSETPLRCGQCGSAYIVPEEK